MIFKLHYWFMASGANALGILLGVFIAEYTDATPFEIGLVYMLMPFLGLIFRPIICSLADRHQAHQRYMMNCLLVTALSYLPYIAVPFVGPDLYETHPRFCWYFLVSFKIVGDIAFGGASSIGDSLAVNYAHRIGTDFSVYRIWATISWMVFGFIIGQINEIWFMPKYVPAFIILIVSTLLDAFVIWLWPPEYFVIVPVNETLRKGVASAAAAAANNNNNNNHNHNNNVGEKEAPPKKVSAMTKSLMPKEVVWAHVKRKLQSLLSCSCWSLASARLKSEPITGKDPTGGESREFQQIDRQTQIKVLLLLLRRDPRILLYAAMFVCAGATVVPMSFFYMNLSELCHTDNRCDFSQLGGLLQVSMASVEALIFLYISRIIRTLGRLNTVSIGFALAALKYGFYATPYWHQLNPYFALITEIAHGVMFSIYLTLMVELAHFFSNEVEFIIGELVERGVLASDDEASNARLKMSLAATMQALMASANDGLGRGVGALIYGAILNYYTYDELWLAIGLGAGVVFVLVQAVNLFDKSFQPQLGLDEQYKRRQALESAAAATTGADQLAAGPTLVVAAAAAAEDTISIASKLSASNTKLAQVA